MYTNRSFKGIAAAGLLAIGLFGSCSKKVGDAYQNPNAQVVEPIETLLPNVIANFVGSSTAANTGNGIAPDCREIGRYVQYWAQNSNAYQYDQIAESLVSNGGTLGYTWTMHYTGDGQNITRIIEWGTQQKKWDYVGVAWAVRAWSWLALSDEYGNIILREAFNTSRTQFDYDTVQAEAYDTVRANAFRALDFLSRTGDGVSQANLAKGDAYFYNGDVNKWKKFVYGVLARSYAHLTNKPDFVGKYADSVIKYVDLAMNSNDDNALCTFQSTAVSGTKNYYGPFRGNMGPVRQGQYIADLLGGNNPQFPGIVDPRAWYLIRENSNGTFKGIRPAYGATTSTGLSTADLPPNFWGGAYTATTATNDANSRYIFRDAAPFPIMTAAEMQFLKSEAAFRKGDKATALSAYTNGVSLEFDMLTNTYGTNIPAANVITPSSKQTYMSNTTVVPTDPAQLTLSHIMLQKYIALYGWGAQETWVDMRRYHYIDPDPATGHQVYTAWQPLNPSDIYVQNNGKYVYRARPQNTSEYLYNIIPVTAMGGMAPDYCTREVWFSTPGAN